jgi:hypothetical protein
MDRSKRFIIRYAVPNSDNFQNVSLKVYNLRGELVRILAEHRTKGGRFIMPWDCRGRSGAFLCASSYILVLEVGNQRITALARIMK